MFTFLSFFFFFFLEKRIFVVVFSFQSIPCTVYETHKLFYSATFFLLKMGLIALFTYLKIILLQCFQFSFFSKINYIQTDPKPKYLEDWKKLILFYFLRKFQPMTSDDVLLIGTYAIYLFWISLK